MKINNLKMNLKRCVLLTAISLMCTSCSKKNYSDANIDIASINDLDEFQYIVLDEDIETDSNINTKKQIVQDLNKEITISFAGDCTLGNDKTVGYFNDMVEKQNNDYSYFLRNVRGIFSKDDYTLVNLETTLTDATEYAEKKFNFKGNPDYVSILKTGSVEGVNIANNHSKDYLEKGYQDTINTLESVGIDYSGNEYVHIEDIKGIKVGFIGFSNSNLDYKNIDDKLNQVKLEGAQLIVASCHWGIESNYQFNQEQQNIGHYLIDNGADVVIGHHPHVLQGIEKYKGKYIVYSLGNFCFGGKRNPKDKDSMIFKETFIFDDKNLDGTNIEIIPCFISSVDDYNNFQPTPLTDEEKNRVIEKVKANSYNFNY